LRLQDLTKGAASGHDCIAERSACLVKSACRGSHGGSHVARARSSKVMIPCTGAMREWAGIHRTVSHEHYTRHSPGVMD
jgi:hypothetical protein